MNSSTPTTHIAIIDYPHALQSAIFGCSEMFLLTNHFCQETSHNAHFQTDIIPVSDINQPRYKKTCYTAIFIPPALNDAFYRTSSQELDQWLIEKHEQGSILCSACAGAFILASTGLLDQREVTTHCILLEAMSEQYPQVHLSPNQILINDGDIMTAGGMMSWVDLGLELVAQLTTPAIMRQLGRMLVVDTGRREQRYYQQFAPSYTHGDAVILRVQKHLQTHYQDSIKMADLAQQYCLTERTFLRRFIKATQLKPSEYLQRLRIQKVCDLLESTSNTFDAIANTVGYKDTGACRKAFVNIMGLTPQEFKGRFTGNSENLLDKAS